MPKLREAITPLQLKKKHKGKSKWSAAEEAAIIATLLAQKQARNVSESGFKPSVWSLVATAVQEATTEDVGKDIVQCKTCYHKVSRFFCLFLSISFITHYLQLKSEYKLVKTLRGLSGFGWDEGNQMVTVPLSVWEKYIAVSAPLT